MRLLHTSDWHIGRTFHGHSTLTHLRQVLDALVEVVRDRKVDVVLVAGDVFDSATPAADAYEVLTDALLALRNAGAVVVVTSGNHDSATRLGFQSSFAAAANIHVLTKPEQLATPVELVDEHGPVCLYGLPFLEPSIVRHRLGADDPARLRTQGAVLSHAMDLVRADAAHRGGRSVVLAHCFAAAISDAAAVSVDAPAAIADDAADGEIAQTRGLERDITAGGLDVVPLSVFDGPDYVALGHIHGRAQLSERVRYSGAPLHYTFSEAGKPRGGWLVELGASGLDSVEWVDLPVPRALAVLSGTLDELLTDKRFAANEGDWVAAVITDQSRPLDAMRKLQTRFPFCANLEHRPEIVVNDTAVTYAERMRSRSDSDIVGGFLEHVRNGVGASEHERAVVAAVVAAAAAEGAA